MMTSIGSRPVFSGSGFSDPVMRPILTPRTVDSIAAARRVRPGRTDSGDARERRLARIRVGSSMADCLLSASSFGRAMS